MINTFIAYDDNDIDFGDYFIASHTDISNAISQNALVQNISIRGINCTEVNINSRLLPVNGGKFIFIALSHGNEDELLSHVVYVSANNAHFFTNSLFYSTACLTACNLSNTLMQSGCHTFIGYDEEVHILDDYSQDFYTCENFAIKSFLLNDETIEESFNKMKEFYNQKIEELLSGSIDNVIAATWLINNKDCLVLMGDKNLTRNDFV